MHDRSRTSRDTERGRRRCVRKGNGSSRRERVAAGGRRGHRESAASGHSRTVRTVDVQITEATALATSALAAVAATASWANVLLTRRSLNESVLPSLHVTGINLRTASPLGTNETMAFDVYNAGGGIAKGPAFVLTHAGQYVIGIAAPMIGPGQTYRITTDMESKPDDSWGGMVGCLDFHNHRRLWRLHNPRPEVYRREDDSETVLAMYKRVFPDVDIEQFTRRRTTIRRTDD
jgi:hypothetical protein